MKKRVMTLFLALAMCLTLLPAVAVAADSDNNMAYVVHLTQYSLAGADEATRTSIQNGIYNLLFQAQFRPTKGPSVDGITATFTGTTSEVEKWYPQNKDNYASSVKDSVLGTVNLGESCKGCMSYPLFVSNYIYNTNGVAKEFSGKLTRNNIKSFIELYANPGVRMSFRKKNGVTHAFAFLGEDAAQNGFYCLSYGGGASKSVGTHHTLEVQYYTYDDFVNSIDRMWNIRQVQGGAYSQGTARPLNRTIQRIGGSSTPETAIITDGTYTLAPACAPNARLDVAGGSQTSGANVQIHTDNGTNAQKWEIKSIGNGNYTLTSKGSGHVLVSYHYTAVSGDNVMQCASYGGFSGEWKFKDAGDGYYYIIPRSNENLCLDVDSAYSSDGTNVQVFTANQTSAQKWKLTRVDQAASTPGHTHQGTFLWCEAAHPHYNYYKCSICGEQFTDYTTTRVSSCSSCNSGHWGDWSDWSSTPVTATGTREVETRQVNVSDGYTEYRYGRYAYTDYRLHTCWCETYMTKLFGGATLQYSDWSSTRYYPTGKGWSCGNCNGNHIGVDHYTNGKPWWAEYSLPDGDYFWEESRIVGAQTQTQYRYRDWINN